MNGTTINLTKHGCPYRMRDGIGCISAERWMIKKPLIKGSCVMSPLEFPLKN